MRILGIDPGTALTGYGIVDVQQGELVMVTYGVIRTSKRDTAPRRLQCIYQELNAILQQYRPESAGVEEIFFGRNVTTAITVGQARGVVLLALENAGLTIAEYSPPKIKNAVAGYGNAGKKQVQLMVRHMLNLEETPRPDDAADGLAVAITHYYYQKFAALGEDS
jgi:crossover junction endodeoxyribonuclease RuvC